MLDTTLKFISVTFFSSIICSSIVFGFDGWKPVTPEELAQKTPKVEVGADAEAIFWETKADDGGNDLSVSHYIRIKIFTLRGRDQFSKVTIPYYKGTKITDLTARVIKADGNIIEINRSDTFDREIVNTNNSRLFGKSFAVQQIDIGSIFEYQYKEQINKFSLSNEPLFFQHEIPIWKLSYFVRPKAEASLTPEVFNLPNDVTFDNATDGYFVAVRYDVPALISEPKMPPIKSVRSWMLAQYNMRRGESGWGQYARVIQTQLNTVLRRKSDFKTLANALTINETSDEAKIRKLFHYSQSQIKNKSFDSLESSGHPKWISTNNQLKTIKDLSGSSEDINMLFFALASSLGFETRIAMCGDRSEYFFDPLINSSHTFIQFYNVAVKLKNRYVYFNPGIPYLPFGRLEWNQEMVGTILVGENNWVTHSTPLSDETVSLSKRNGSFRLLEDGTLEGNATIEYYGHRAADLRRSGFFDTASKRQANFRDEILAQMPNAILTNIAITNFEHNSLPLIYTFKIKIPNYAQKTGKRMFIQPGFFEYGEKPVFSNAKRVHPIYFRYPWSEDDSVEIEFPKNFQVDSIDQPTDIADPAKIGSLAITIQPNSDKTGLIYTRNFYFGKGQKILFPASVYTQLKNLFDIFHRSNSHSITLRQK